jgi:hypothetical protein
MLSRSFLTIFFAAHIVLAQEATAPANQDHDAETVFQHAVQDGLRPSDMYSASVFVLSHENTAIPILLRSINENLGRNNPEEFVSRAVELIVYSASDRGIDAIADLCSVDPKRFTPYVKRLLDHAINRNREYELVYHALETDPQIRDAVVRWLQDSLDFPQADVALAKEVLRRENSGHSGSESDAVMALIPFATRERVLRAVEKVRSDERERQRKQQ